MRSRQLLERPEIGQRGLDRRAFLRRTALTGIAARLGEQHIGRLRQKQRLERQWQWQRQRGRVRLASELQIRGRQPRHD